MKKVNNKYILVCNIFIFISLFTLLYKYNNASTLITHDHFWPYYFKIDELPSSRIPALFFNYLYTVKLPEIFNINPNDFRVNFFVCSLITLYLISPFIILLKTFLLLIDKAQTSVINSSVEGTLSSHQNLFTRVETIFLLPFIFLILMYPDFIINDSGHAAMADFAVYFEHNGAYPFYFLFIYGLINILTNEKNIKLSKIFLYSLTALILGMWSEVINLSIFFTIIFISPYFFLKMNKIKIKNFLCIISSFLLGFCLFYFVIGNFSFNHIGTIGEYNIIEKLSENFSNFHNFINIYFDLYFRQHIILWTIFVINIIAILFIGSKEKKLGIILIATAIILGILATNFTSIFLSNYREGSEEYLMLRPTFQLIFINWLESAIIILFGYLYGLFNIKQKLSSLIIVFIFSIILLIKFIPIYNVIQNERIEKRNLYRNIEKNIVIYSTLGESALVPSSYIDYIVEYFALKHELKFFEKENSFYVNKFWPKNFFLLKFYYKTQYKNDFNGIIFVNDQYAKEELLKREHFIQYINPDFVKDNNNFEAIKKYENIEIKIEDLNKYENKFGKQNFLLKYRASLYLKNGEKQKALELYKKVLNQNNKDYDSLIKLSQIYEENNDLKNAKAVYKKLLILDPTNLVFNHNLAKIYYLEENYKEADKIYSEIEANYSYPNTIYINHAIISHALNKKEEVKEHLLKNKDYELINNIIKSNNLKNETEFINSNLNFQLSNQLILD